MATKKKIKVRREVRVNVYRILDDAMENAVRYGYNRAFKHTDSAGEVEITDQIHQAVMSELCELFTWEDPYENEA